MSEAHDYEPAPWAKGEDFKEATEAYHRRMRARDASPRSPTQKVYDLLKRDITTNALTPFIYVIDLTGSMDEWPGIIFGKIPYLWHEITHEYLGSETEICMIGSADAYNDPYPIQCQGFAAEAEIRNRLDALVLQDGGGQQSETYELTALYLIHHVHFPRAIRKPVLLIIGDEMPYPFVSTEMAKRWVDVDLPKRISTEEVFRQLMGKYDAYFVRKPYGHVRHDGDALNEQIHCRWVELLGPDRVYVLPDPERIVDETFGILGRATGREEYSREEIRNRQTPAQARIVFESLDTTHRHRSTVKSHDHSGHSRLRDDDDA